MIRLYTFLIFVAMSTVLLYVFFIMPQSYFVGKTSLLIIPKTIVIASNADNIVNDIVFIANESIKHNADVQSYVMSVDVNRLKSHDIVQIVVQSESKNGITSIEKSVLKSVITDIEKYYTINTDFAIKIAQSQVIQKDMLVQVASYVVMIVVVIGVIAGVLALFYMIDLMKSRGEYDDNISGEKIFAGYNVDKHTIGSKVKDIDYEIEQISNDNHAVIQSDDEDISTKEEFVQSEQREKDDVVVESQVNEVSLTDISAPDGLSTTPGNLPIIDTNDFGFGSVEKTTIDNENTSSDDGEPTEEELKARLNELLNGKL